MFLALLLVLPWQALAGWVHAPQSGVSWATQCDTATDVSSVQARCETWLTTLGAAVVTKCVEDYCKLVKPPPDCETLGCGAIALPANASACQAPSCRHYRLSWTVKKALANKLVALALKITGSRTPANGTDWILLPLIAFGVSDETMETDMWLPDLGRVSNVTLYYDGDGHLSAHAGGNGRMKPGWVRIAGTDGGTVTDVSFRDQFHVYSRTPQSPGPHIPPQAVVITDKYYDLVNAQPLCWERGLCPDRDLAEQYGRTVPAWRERKEFAMMNAARSDVVAFVARYGKPLSKLACDAAVPTQVRPFYYSLPIVEAGRIKAWELARSICEGNTPATCASTVSAFGLPGNDLQARIEASTSVPCVYPGGCPMSTLLNRTRQWMSGVVTGTEATEFVGASALSLVLSDRDCSRVMDAKRALAGIAYFPEPGWVPSDPAVGYGVGVFDCLANNAKQPWNSKQFSSYMPIPSGSHFLHAVVGGSHRVRFMAQYYDTDREDPVTMQLVLDGKTMAMTRVFGLRWQATYEYEMTFTSLEGCHSYYFRCSNSRGVFTLPQSGSVNFRTYGVGRCLEDFVPAHCDERKRGAYDACRSTCGYPGNPCLPEGGVPDLATDIPSPYPTILTPSPSGPTPNSWPPTTPPANPSPPASNSSVTSPPSTPTTDAPVSVPSVAPPSQHLPPNHPPSSQSPSPLIIPTTTPPMPSPNYPSPSPSSHPPSDHGPFLSPTTTPSTRSPSYRPPPSMHSPSPVSTPMVDAGQSGMSWSAQCNTVADLATVHKRCSLWQTLYGVVWTGECVQAYCDLVNPYSGCDDDDDDADDGDEIARCNVTALPAERSACQGPVCRHYRVSWSLDPAGRDTVTRIIKITGSLTPRTGTNWLVLPYLSHGARRETMETDLWVPDMGEISNVTLYVNSEEHRPENTIDSPGWVRIAAVDGNTVTDVDLKFWANHSCLSGFCQFAVPTTVATTNKYYDLVNLEPACWSRGLCPHRSQFGHYSRTVPSWRERKEFVMMNAARNDALAFVKHYGTLTEPLSCDSGTRTQVPPFYYSETVVEACRLKARELALNLCPGEGSLSLTCASSVTAFGLPNPGFVGRVDAHAAFPCVYPRGDCGATKLNNRAETWWEGGGGVHIVGRGAEGIGDSTLTLLSNAGQCNDLMSAHSAVAGVGYFPKTWDPVHPTSDYSPGVFVYLDSSSKQRWSNKEFLSYMPLPSGSHFIVDTAGSPIVRFVAQYYDSEREAPATMHLVLEGETVPMTRVLGLGWQATYEHERAFGTAEACHSYFFRCANSHGVFTLPQSGSIHFRTYGVGRCLQDFSAARCDESKRGASDACRSTCGYPGKPCRATPPQHEMPPAPVVSAALRVAGTPCLLALLAVCL